MLRSSFKALFAVLLGLILVSPLLVRQWLGRGADLPQSVSGMKEVVPEAVERFRLALDLEQRGNLNAALDAFRTELKTKQLRAVSQLAIDRIREKRSSGIPQWWGTTWEVILDALYELRSVVIVLFLLIVADLSV